MEFSKALNWRPGAIFEDLEQLAEGFGPLVSKSARYHFFEYRRGDMHFASAVQPRAGADRLYVTIQSMFGRAEVEPPYFMQRPWLENIGVNLLGVSDPALFLSKSLNVCLFVGTAERDLIDDLVDLAQGVARSLGVANDRIVFLGHSAGAFPCGMAAIRSGGKAVLVNPLIECESFVRSGWGSEVARIFGSDPQTMVAEVPLRMSIITALQKAREEGRTPRLTIMQNTEDFRFWTKNFLPFCEAFGIDKAGGYDVSGSLRGLPFTDEAGHTSQPPQMILNAMDDLLKPVEKSVTEMPSVETLVVEETPVAEIAEIVACSTSELRAAG